MIASAFIALSLIAANPAIGSPTQPEMNADPVATIARLAVQFCYLENNGELTAPYEACVREQQVATVEFFETAQTMINAGQDIIEPLTDCLNTNIVEGVALDTRRVRDCFYDRIGALKGTY
jgi:hypothetical protein